MDVQCEVHIRPHVLIIKNSLRWSGNMSS
uniref:Uncharacterized protein n=1 Tax=Anguilla anguilla TaxID=7936 RepID=A0A0E9SYG1_ANGAN